jgi:hypothetical protein
VAEVLSFLNGIDGDGDRVVTMSSRAFSDIGQIEGEIFYTGFVGPRDMLFVVSFD